MSPSRGPTTRDVDIPTEHVATNQNTRGKREGGTVEEKTEKEKQDENTTCDRVTSKLHGRINNFLLISFLTGVGGWSGLAPLLLVRICLDTLSRICVHVSNRSPERGLISISAEI